MHFVHVLDHVRDLVFEIRGPEVREGAQLQATVDDRGRIPREWCTAPGAVHREPVGECLLGHVTAAAGARAVAGQLRVMKEALPKGDLRGRTRRRVDRREAHDIERRAVEHRGCIHAERPTFRRHSDRHRQAHLLHRAAERNEPL